MGIVMKIGKFYRRLLCRHPLLVQSLQSGILMGLGDVMAQKGIEKKCDLDYLRTVRFFSLGTLMVGPALTKWYKFLSRIVDDRSKYASFKKMALDQIVFAPTFLCLFLVTLNLIEKRGYETIKRELCDKYTDILISNYKLWPIAQTINFALMPLAYQVLFVQTIALFWNAYLSWKTQQEIKEN